jgi:hypothetical protein
MDYFFDVPFYRNLTEVDGWNDVSRNRTKYDVSRFIFKLVTADLPEESKYGDRLAVFGGGMGCGVTREQSIKADVDIVDECQTLRTSISEIKSLKEIGNVNHISVGYDNAAAIKNDLSLKAKKAFSESFKAEQKLTVTTKIHSGVEYKFTETVGENCSEVFCVVTPYKKVRADLYLLAIDFLSIEYKKEWFGLRKKRIKKPFPNGESKNRRDKHPNIIPLGIPVAELNYWQPVTEGPRVVKDKLYYPLSGEEINTINVLPARKELKHRYYWDANNTPTLYQLSNVAFPLKWIDKPQAELSRDELMQIELGEAEEGGWTLF